MKRPVEPQPGLLQCSGVADLNETSLACKFFRAEDELENKVTLRDRITSLMEVT